jgi:hypothetical protein
MVPSILDSNCFHFFENPSSTMIVPHLLILGSGQSEHPHICLVVICDSVYDGEWLVDISFVVPLGSVKFGLCVD